MWLLLLPEGLEILRVHFYLREFCLYAVSQYMIIIIPYVADGTKPLHETVLANYQWDL